jgi:hypothetical protein
VRVSICHCFACQKRTGSAFGYQARFPREQIRDLISIAIGAFADPAFHAPRHSVYEASRHHWVALPANAEHLD